ncbi:MAG: tail tube protein [Chaetfec virus UA24_144]|nr:MAG: tail tube protein [Chaetfec virus UA24_144]
MAKLVWDQTGHRFYEMGTDHGVLYPQTADGTYPKGVVWNGLTAITESPGGAEPTDLYADNIKYATLRSAETFGATIEAYTYPDEFAICDGSAELTDGVFLGQQSRNAFGLSYVTQVGNDTQSSADDGYKLHLVYGATASPSQKSYATINESPDAITFSWEVTTTPVAVTGFKPVSTIVIDSLKVDKEKLAALEKILYGSESEEARLPLPDEVATLFGPGDTDVPSGDDTPSEASEPLAYNSL